MNKIEIIEKNIEKAEKENNNDDMIKFCLQALEESKNLNDPLKKAHYYYLIGKAYYAKNDLLKAIDSIEKNIEILKISNDILPLKTSYEFIVKIYKELGDHQNALKYLESVYELLSISVNDKGIFKKIEKIKHQQQLLMQKSKLESLGNLASGIAHEINQPLGTIAMAIDNLYLKQMNDQLTQEYFQKKYEILSKNLQRIKRIIQQVRIFSRKQEFFKMEEIDVNKLLEETCVFITTQYKNHNIDLRFDLEEDLGFTIGTKQKLEQVFLNLLSNSRHALEKIEGPQSEKKNIVLRTYSSDKQINIEVEDNGIGLTKEEIDMIFDPFYTTKDTDTGTGIGLSISLKIIEEMNGTLKYKSEKGKYTIARIALPEYKKEADKI